MQNNLSVLSAESSCYWRLFYHKINRVILAKYQSTEPTFIGSAVLTPISWEHNSVAYSSTGSAKIRMDHRVDGSADFYDRSQLFPIKDHWKATKSVSHGALLMSTY